MIHITLEPEFDIEPGHQWIVVPNTKDGHALVRLLTGDRPPIRRGDQLLVPHDAKVDARILHLIDQLAHARYQAPGLIQMTLKEIQE